MIPNVNKLTDYTRRLFRRFVSHRYCKTKWAACYVLSLFRRFVSQPTGPQRADQRTWGRVGKHKNIKMARRKLLLCATYLMLESKFEEVKKRRRQVWTREFMRNWMLRHSAHDQDKGLGTKLCTHKSLRDNVTHTDLFRIWVPRSSCSDWTATFCAVHTWFSR